ncbi:MAG: DNA double-strand break repair nuclease NurA [Candidatus Bipolaricaulia bacterium]
MLSAEVKRKLLEGVREFSLAFDPRRFREEAERAFAELELDGPTQALTPLSYRSGPLLELAARPEARFRRAFGLDGGSTRPIHFANGSTLCANQAVLVSAPQSELEGLPLDSFRTVALVSHSLSASGGPKAEYREDRLLGLWRIHITRDYLWGSEIDHVLKGLADSASEARHALRMTERLALGQEDFLLLDGNVFPIGLYYLLKGRSSGGGDLLSFPGAIEALAGHLRLAEALAQRGTAYVGINKTPQTAYLLEALPGRGPWADDRQLIRALFLGLPKDELGWTNWFIQERYRAPARPGLKAEGSDIFRELREFEPKLPPEKYHVAYFFVYDPRTAEGQGSVLKVEAPRLIFDRHDPEELQLAVLSEIARGEGVPPLLRRADSRARITQEEREALIKSSGLPPDLGYNQGRGEPW